MSWRSFVYLVLALAAVVGAYVLVWVPCLGSMLGLAALALSVTTIVSAFRARRAARRANESSSPATAGLLLGTTAFPFVAVAVLGTVTLNGLVTTVSMAMTFPGVAIAPFMPRHSTAEDRRRERADAVAFWNGGYIDLIPTDVEHGEPEGEVRRSIRVLGPFVLIAAVGLVGLANSENDPPTTEAGTPPSEPESVPNTVPDNVPEPAPDTVPEPAR